jgi:broad specificity phosphatase PhoE
VRADAAEDVLWQRLRSGGHILLIRHAATDPGVGDPPGFRLGACATQRNLSERGRREARALGAALQAGGVTIGPVWSSRWCRCLDTARLAFGHVEPTPMLDSMFNDDEAASHAKAERTIARLVALRGTGQDRDNVALVTHDVNIRALTRESVAPGGIVVARMAGGRLAVLGQLSIGSASQTWNGLRDLLICRTQGTLRATRTKATPLFTSIKSKDAWRSLQAPFSGSHQSSLPTYPGYRSVTGFTSK